MQSTPREERIAIYQEDDDLLGPLMRNVTTGGILCEDTVHRITVLPRSSAASVLLCSKLSTSAYKIDTTLGPIRCFIQPV
jgi:hypothetical protein